MRSRLVLLIIAILAGYTSRAQTSRSDPNDVQGRYGVEIDINLPKKWEIGVDYQARYRNNLQSYRGSYFTISPQKELFKNFTVITAYRIALLDGAVYHRGTVGADYRIKWERFSLGFRGLVQNQVEEFEQSDKETNNDIYWRVRVGGSCKITDKFDIYASTEPIMMIDGIYFIDNWRQTVGLKWEVAKRTKLDFYYIYRPDYAKTYNRRFDIIGFNLNYELKIKGK